MESEAVKARYVPAPEQSRNSYLLAREILAAAQAQADKTLADSRARAAAGIRKTYRRAKQSGIRRGLFRGRKLLLAELFKLQDSYRDIVSKANQDCLELAVQIAEQILGQQVQINRNSLALRIESAIAALIDKRNLKVFVAAKDMAELQKILHEQRSALDFSVLPLDSIAVGNARIESPAGCLDLNWRQDLSSLRESLNSKLVNAETG